MFARKSQTREDALGQLSLSALEIAKSYPVDYVWLKRRSEPSLFFPWLGDVLMDCDRVFVVLTRGPFPTGDPEDAEVQEHLDGCLDCWRLAEALRPAEHLFQESVPAAESRDLPGYWGDTTPPSVTVTRLVERTAKPKATPPAIQPQAQPQPLCDPNDRTAQRVDLLWVGAVLCSVVCLSSAIALWAWWLKN